MWELFQIFEFKKWCCVKAIAEGLGLSLLSSMWTSIAGSLQGKPQDSTVEEGSRFTLECATDLSFSVDWHFYRNDGIKHEIYSNGQMSPSFSSQYSVEAHRDTGVYNLIIHNMSKIHEGTYVCVDDEGLGPDKASAIVSVISADGEKEVLPPMNLLNNNWQAVGTNLISTNLTTTDEFATVSSSITPTTEPPIMIIMGIVAAVIIVIVIVIIVSLIQIWRIKGKKRGKNKDSKEHELVGLSPGSEC